MTSTFQSSTKELISCEICADIKCPEVLQDILKDMNKTFKIDLFQSFRDFNLDTTISSIKNFKTAEPNFSPVPKLLKFRKNIIDWMYIISKSINISENSFYNSIELFDEFSRIYHFKIELKDFELIASTCLFISSKISNEGKLSIHTTCSNILKNEFSKNDILACEILILKKINFHLPRIEGLIFFEKTIQKLFAFMRPDQTNKGICYCKFILFLNSLQLCRLVYLDYQLFYFHNRVSIYFAIIYLSIEKYQNAKEIMNNQNLMKETFLAILKLHNIAEEGENEILIIVQKIDSITNDINIHNMCEFMRKDYNSFENVLASL
jgi:hypothetical protein